MPKVFLIVLGAAAALAAALWVGAAAATTGAPVFYDARHPTPATSTSEGYLIDPDGTAQTRADDPAASGDADGHGAPSPGDPHSTQAPIPPRSTVPPASTPHPTPHAGADPGVGPGDVDRGSKGNGSKGNGSKGNGPKGNGSDGNGSDNIGSERGGVPVPSPAEQQQWLAFQQIVRDCMADSGHDYLYWEWWNPGAGVSSPFAAMPTDLTPDQQSSWQLALDGDAQTGAGYRWQDAGCWGYAVHVAGTTN